LKFRSVSFVLLAVWGNHQDNTTPRNFKWKVLEHPPYSPGFHLVGPLKHHLLAEHFPNDEAVERELTAWFRQQPEEFYDGFPGHVK
jgi:hypothetical protein